jgi:hypothetical protein
VSFNWQGLGYSDGATITATVIPIPAAAWLFASALLGLSVVARRRNARAQAAGA